MGLFDKLFSSNKPKKRGLETKVDDVKKSREGMVNVGQNLFPVLKSSDFISPKLNELISEGLSDELKTYYSLDIGDSFEIVSESLLASTGLTAEQIKHTSMRNLYDKVSKQLGIKDIDLSDQIPQSKAFYTIHFDTNFNPSVMLVDEFWDGDILKKYINDGRIAVSIPTKDMIFFADMRIMESFRSMRAYSTIFYDSAEKEGKQLSKNTYIRKDGKWIKFLDTEQQWEELW